MTVACNDHIMRKSQEYMSQYESNLENKAEKVAIMAAIKKRMESKGMNIVREKPPGSINFSANLDFIDWNRV